MVGRGGWGGGRSGGEKEGNSSGEEGIGMKILDLLIAANVGLGWMEGLGWVEGLGWALEGNGGVGKERVKGRRKGMKICWILSEL